MTVKQYNLVGIAVGMIALALLLSTPRPPSIGGKSAPSVSADKPPASPPNLPEHKIKHDFTAVASNNLFHPSRGKSIPDKENNTTPVNRPRGILKFELKGVCHSGGRYAALIVCRGGSASKRGDDLKKADSDLYHTGNEIADGYILKEVKKRSVLIERGQEKIELELMQLRPPGQNSNTLKQPSIQKNNLGK